MKTLAKILLRLSLAVLPCLAVACTSEVETTGGTPETPENPQANDPNRRSVVISLQNKLILVQGTPESRPMTRDGIAEDDENRIGSLDIYAFGSDKEEGPYTFQERFAYRAEAGKLPAGVSPLDLKSDEAAGRVNVVFYPRKGLFTKFYCVANQTELNDATGHEYTGYTPLQQNSQQAGVPGDAVTTPGIPTENDFIKLNTPLLEPTGFNTDILLAPLPMSGASSQPVDLREYSMGTYVRLNVSLSRAVVRFDVVNDAAKSHFTITDIAMGNGRQGVTLFPIRPTGDVPATPGQLITYPYRPFDGLNANIGTTTKAFYCYPCKAMDEGFLILKGLYAVNLTDEKKEVSYRIPFERVSDGNGTRIEINHNHRYTVQITEADPFELTANIRLVDWETGDYIDDYEPDNGLEAITVADLLPVDETTYEPNTNIVTLLLKAGSSFTVTTGSNAGVDAKLTYYGGTAETEWLKWEEIPVTTTRAETTKQVKYKVSFKENYTGDSYPRGILRLMDKAGGSEEVVLIDTTYGIPEVETIGGEMNPSGVSNWNAAESTLYLAQVVSAGTSSTGKITVTSIGGSKIELPVNSDITVTPTSSTHTTQEYTFQWAATTASDLTEKEIAVNVLNNSDHTKIGNIKVKLLPNRINNLQLTTAPSDIKLSDITTTTATLTMPIIKDKQFTLTMDNYSKPTLSTKPSWLEVVTSPAIRSAPESLTTNFTFRLIEDAENFADTELVFTNASGGTGMTVNITRVFQAPTITDVSGATPSANSFSSNTVYLQHTKTGSSTTKKIRIYSLGGHTFVDPNLSSFYKSSTKVNNYTTDYTVGSSSWNNYTGTESYTIPVKNVSDESKVTNLKMQFRSSRPSISGASGYSNAFNLTGYDTYGYLYVNDDASLYGTYNAKFRLYSECGFSANSSSVGILSISRTKIWSSNSKYDEFNLSIPGSPWLGSTTEGNYTFGTVTFSAVNESGYYNDYQLTIYNKLPITAGYWAYKVGGKFFSKVSELNVSLSTARSKANSVGNGWKTPTASDVRNTIFTSLPSSVNDKTVNTRSVPSYFFNILPAINQYRYLLIETSTSRTGNGYGLDYQTSGNVISYGWGDTAEPSDHNFGTCYVLVHD